MSYSAWDKANTTILMEYYQYWFESQWDAKVTLCFYNSEISNTTTWSWTGHKPGKKVARIFVHWVYMSFTFATMSRCPWLAAKCRGVSSPRFMTLMRAPLMMSMSTTLERPSLHAQWRGLKPWSSLQWQKSTETTSYPPSSTFYTTTLNCTNRFNKALWLNYYIQIAFQSKFF